MAKQLPSKLKKRIQAAQEWKQYLIQGKYYDRIPIGQEDQLIELKDNCCLHCFAAKKQLHCLGCFFETCPACGKLTWDCICEAYLDDNKTQ